MIDEDETNLSRKTSQRFQQMIVFNIGDESYRSIAARTGIPPSTLSRLRQGGEPDLVTLDRLCKWLSMSADRVLLLALQKDEDEQE